MKTAADLVSCVLVGALIGFYLDKWLSTKPLFFVVCIVLGAVAGFKTIMADKK